jgi:hypothetical protein
MLSGLTERGMIYKNRFGKYSFAVPLLGRFITRTYWPPGAKPELQDARTESNSVQ